MGTYGNLYINTFIKGHKSELFWKYSLQNPTKTLEQQNIIE